MAKSVSKKNSSARRSIAKKKPLPARPVAKGAARVKPPARPTARVAAPKAAKAAPPAKRVPAARKPAKAVNHVQKPVRKLQVREARSSPVEPTPPAQIPEAVPTDGKPRKNQAGLNVRDLEHFRDLLLAKRREIVGDMSSMEREALRSSGGTNLSTLPIHMADMGTDNYEQEFTLGLVEKDRNLLREINAALGKIQNGTYGICEGTGKPIAKARLEAQPWARFSIEHARTLERGLR